jgi:DNA-binding PadR family transcriptional regulator
VVGGRRRREYQLTPAGIRALSGRRAAWRDFSATVTAALESATLLNTALENAVLENAALEDTACPSPNPA